MSGISSKAESTLVNKYKYNGKELQSNEFSDGSGLELFDYGARMYDAQIGRMPTQDRYAHAFSSINPYHYCANNPISYVDVNGDYISKEIEGKDGKSSTYIYGQGADGWGFYNDGKKYSGDDGQINSLAASLEMLATNENEEISGRFNTLAYDDIQHNINFGDGDKISSDKLKDASGKLIGTNTPFSTVANNTSFSQLGNIMGINNGTKNAQAQFASNLLSITYSETTQGGNIKGNQILPNGYLANGGVYMFGPSNENEINNGRPSFTTPQYTGYQGATIFSDRAYIQNLILAQIPGTSPILFYSSPVFYGNNCSKVVSGVTGIFSIKWNNVQIPFIKLK